MTGRHRGDVVDDGVEVATAGEHHRMWWPEIRRGQDLGTIVGLTVVIAVPVVVALVTLHEPRWFPLVDMAQIEMRVRDVTSTHPPTLGLGGRIRGYGRTGSHPGPIAFYLLWPVYWLLGSSAWALQVAAATMSLVAIGLAVWIGQRRGGTAGAFAVAAMVALLLRLYGTVMVTEPWNPRLPIMWWLVCGLAVWSVICGDLVLLPLVVVAGTICVQTHIPYAAPVGGLWLLTVVVLVRRRRTLGRRQLLPSAALFALVWAPPLFDQLARRPGNVAIILENFRHPYDVRPPLGEARDFWLRHLDVTALLRGNADPYVSSPGRGLLFLVAWAATAVYAWRRRVATLTELHAVVGLAMALGALAISRIFGPLWPYLAFWAWGTTALAVLAIGWTLASRPRSADNAGAPTLQLPPLRLPQPTMVALGVVGLGAVALATAEAPDTELPGTHLSATLAELAGPTVERLREDPAGCGDGCTYFVSWMDPVDIGAMGYGMVIELERQGFAARTDPYEGEAVRFHRTAALHETDAEIHVAMGDHDIRAWKLIEDAEMLAIVEPGTPAERAELRRKREELLLDLHTHGLHDLAETVATTDPITFDPRMSPEAHRLVEEVNGIERPSAVFLRVPGDPVP